MRLLGFLALALLSLAWVGAPAQQSKRKEETEEPRAKQPVKPIPNIEEDAPTGATAPAGVMIVAVPELPEFLSPAFARTDAERAALDLIFESLIRPVYDSLTGRGYEPGLASALPRPVVRGRDISLANASWFDPKNPMGGAQVTSADVRTTLDRLRSRGAFESEAIEAIQAESPDRCRVVFRAGIADPLTHLTFKILPAGIVEDEAFARSPVGSGPFAYSGRKTDSGRTYAVFSANPLYAKRFPNRPRLSAIWMVASKNPAADFRAGKVHFALTEQTPSLVSQVSSPTPGSTGNAPAARLEVTLGSGRVGSLPSRRIYYLAVNHSSPRLADRAVRQAIAHGIPRESILTTVYRGGFADHHKPLDGPFPPGTWPCSPLAGKLDDSDLARSLIGSRKPGETTELSLRFPDNDPLAAKACQEISHVFADGSLGITIKPMPTPAAEFSRRVEKDTDFHLAYRHHDYADEWFSPADLLGPRARQYTGYKPSAAFDRLLARAESRRDFGELQRTLQQLHVEFRQEMPFIPLWSLDVHALIDGRLTTSPATPLIDPLAPFSRIGDWSIR